jgi:Tfp pilus assembly protein PilZ
VRLDVTLAGEVWHRYYPNGRLGGLRIDGRPPGQLGQLVELFIAVEQPRREFTLRGQLAWARYQTTDSQKESFGVDLQGDEDAVSRLLSFANNSLDAAAMRAEPRLSVQLPVRLLANGVQRKEIAADLSLTGAFVRSGQPLEVGETLELKLRPPGNLLTASFKARVRWSRQTGDATGMGLEFTDDDAPLRMAKVLKSLQKR